MFGTFWDNDDALLYVSGWFERGDDNNSQNMCSTISWSQRPRLQDVQRNCTRFWSVSAHQLQMQKQQIVKASGLKLPMWWSKLSDLSYARKLKSFLWLFRFEHSLNIHIGILRDLASLAK